MDGGSHRKCARGWRKPQEVCKKWMEEVHKESHRKCARDGWRKPQEMGKRWMEEATGSVPEMDGESDR